MRISDWSSDVCSSDLFELVQFWLGGDQIDDAAGRIATIECALRSTENFHTLKIEKLLLEESVVDHRDIVEADGNARIGGCGDRLRANAADREIIAGEVRLGKRQVRHRAHEVGTGFDLLRVQIL